jgi:hypothetical protein
MGRGMGREIKKKIKIKIKIKNKKRRRARGGIPLFGPLPRGILFIFLILILILILILFLPFFPIFFPIVIPRLSSVPISPPWGLRHTRNVTISNEVVASPREALRGGWVDETLSGFGTWGDRVPG